MFSVVVVVVGVAAAAAVAVAVATAATALAWRREKPTTARSDDEARDDEEERGRREVEEQAELYRAKAVHDKVTVTAEELRGVSSVFTHVRGPEHTITRNEIHATHVPFGFILDGVLSREECAALITELERSGRFSFWNEDPSQRSFRDCDTIELRSESVAKALWDRIKSALKPEELTVRIESAAQDPVRHQRDLEGAWAAQTTNEFVLFTRYGEGGHFAPHTDGFNIVDFDHRSLFSIVLYLNDVAKGDGGETVFFRDEARATLRKDPAQGGIVVADAAMETTAVEPVAGRAVLFFHNTLHQSRPIRPGSRARKYIIRSDVMYRRDPPVLATEADKRAFEEYRQAEALAEKGEGERSAQLYRSAFKKSRTLSRIYGMG